jgi:lysophospholipase L1-like esterase
MALQLTGWLPYGSDDPSVVFAHPLTREIVAADIAGKWTTLSKVGSGNTPTHHATLGMLAVDSGGVDAGYRFQTAATQVSDLDFGGQISYEVQRAYACMNDADNGTVGYIPATDQTVLSARTTGGANLSAMGRKRTDGRFSVLLSSLFSHAFEFKDFILGGALNTCRIHSDGKDEFVLVNIGWWGGMNGGQFVMAVNGMPVGGNTQGFTAASTGRFGDFYIGSYIQNAGTFANGGYIRNLQIAKRPPVFPTHPQLRSVATLSDSLINPFSIDTFRGDNCLHYSLLREIYKGGVRQGTINISQNSGYTITTIATQLETKAQTIIDFNPDTVIIMGGTNDAGIDTSAYVGSTFTSEYRDLLEQLFFGVAKTTRTTISQIFCCTPLPRLDAATNSALSGNALDVRTRIAALPAWWDATWGASYGNGRVKVIDIFQSFGSSHGIMADLAISPDGLHPTNYRGGRLFGEALGRGLRSALL